MPSRRKGSERPSGGPGNDLCALIRGELDVDRAVLAREFDVLVTEGDRPETHGAIDDDHVYILDLYQPSRRASGEDNGLGS